MGTPIYMGQIPGALKRFLTTHKATLLSKP
ncbi:MAG TPA: hypothetical protein DCS67_10475, partial [Clostridiales bacterium UBA8960]|nr:hypothetical protein [Clostridiales bacterium UBA8960]